MVGDPERVDKPEKGDLSDKKTIRYVRGRGDFPIGGSPLFLVLCVNFFSPHSLLNNNENK